MSESIRTMARRVIEEIWNQGKLDVVNELFAGDFVFRAAGFADETRGPEGYKEFASGLRAAFPDLHFSIDNLIVEGDFSALCWTFKGTHTSVLRAQAFNLPATGRVVEFTGFTMSRVRDGKFIEESAWPNSLSYFQQLGLLPDIAVAETSKALMRRVIEELFNQGNLAVADELCTQDYIHHGVQGSLHRGPEGMKQLVIWIRTALPDLHYTIDDLVAEGDKVSARLSFRGTHLGELFGVEPTGRPVMLFGTSTSRIVAGRLAETWAHLDVLEALQQLGAATEIHAGA